ncbi:MAG TPA: glycosyltransferase family 2 protein [Patescibacteria group bacterium]|nr:glycosyltransferase family 2 protein [Patescibacteria group bacterium]
MSPAEATTGAHASATPRGAPDQLDLSVVIPCLNESRTLAACVRGAQRSIQELGLRGEVIVADNGSTDGSQAIAAELGARVVSVDVRGYGSAVRGGIAAARGRFVITGDSDGSHDFSEISLFMDKLREGYDMVIGNRFRAGIRPGTMPPLHRYVGNPLLTRVGQLFFGSRVGDFHSGFRGFRKDVVERLGLRTTGFELCSEMVVKAALFRLHVAEVPTIMLPAGRLAQPHLRTWRDGWRHLRFLLLYSPLWLFLYPGFALVLLGVGLGVWLFPGPRTVGGATFGNGTLLFAGMIILAGFQAISFALCSKVFAISEGLLPEDPRLSRLSGYVNLEVGLTAGTVLLLAGASAWAFSLGAWGSHHFAATNPDGTLRVVIPGLVVLIVGFQTILLSFFLSVLGLPRA